MPKLTDEEEEEILSTSGTRPPKLRPGLKNVPLTTGSRWGDIVAAVKLIDPIEDFKNIGEIPCARKSLMAGIAAGVGIGVIRGVSVGPLFAAHWAMGTFFFISTSTWEICRHRNRQSKIAMQQVARQYYTNQKKKEAAAAANADDAK